MFRILKLLFCLSMIIAWFHTSSSYGQVINGDFSDGLYGWDTYGYVSISEDETAIMRTGGISGPYTTSLTTDFIVSGDWLNFSYYFDTIGPDEIKDPYFPSFGPDYFQVSLDAGGDWYYDIPLAWNPTGGFIPFSVDISSITPGTNATLSFMLFDEDDGYLSVAEIDDVSDPVGAVPEPGTLILIGSGLMGLFAYSRYRGMQRVSLCVLMVCMIQISSSAVVYGEFIEDNVDEMVSLEFTSPFFDTRTNTLTLDMVVTNIYEAAIFTPMRIVITGISSPDVTVANPDSYTPDGLPSFDLTSYIEDDELSPGERARTVKLSFHNPRRVRFRWDQDVIAYVDTYAERGPVIDNICLVPGESPPVCEFYYDDFEIEDPEFDRLLESTLPEMYAYEQVRVYAFDYEDLPLSVIINGMEAVYYEYGFYYYSNLMLQEGFNTISISATNEHGNSATREISLNIDTTPPSITILQPETNIVVTTSEYEITGTVDDPEVESVMLIKDFISREEIPVSNGMFSSIITLLPGHNNISIEAADTAGNREISNLDIVYVYSETGEITGQITNSILDMPIAGVSITVTPDNEGGDYMTALTDEDGQYRIEDVRSGDVAMLAEKEGYNPVNLRMFSPGGSTPSARDIGLMPSSSTDTFTLTGQVKTTGGHPLEGARISVEGISLSTVSDNNGIYIIQGIPRLSFSVNAFREMYESGSLNVSAGMYSENITILTHDFVLDEIVNTIEISSPADGEYVPGEDLLVTGFAGSGDKDVGVRINGVLARVYRGYFMANYIPLEDGVNRITAEMIDLSGTLLTDSIDVTRAGRDIRGVVIHAQEAGLVPAEIAVSIEFPPGILIEESNIEVSGPAATAIKQDGPLQYTVFISNPGIYIITFSGTDPVGNSYTDTFGFTGMAREDIDSRLSLIWTRFKNYLTTNNMEDALSLFTPETKARYEQQFLILGDNLPDIFSDIGDIQLIALKDNVAKTRVYVDGITHYVWFARDIYGLWKIHKF